MDVWASGRDEMKVLNARYLIERRPEGFLFFYINTPSHNGAVTVFVFGSVLTSPNIIQIFKFLIDKSNSSKLDFPCG